MKNTSLFFLLIGFLGVLKGADISSNLESWTWFYPKLFSYTEQEQNKGKAELCVFSKKDIPFYTQSIFSWNAERPEEGFFSFWIQSRNARTKKWSEWYKMVDWGAEKQCSYLVKGSNTRYEHVRLETEPDMADGIRVKITTQAGACMSLVKGCAINTSNMQKFVTEECTTATRFPFVEIKGLEQISQFSLAHERNGNMCSPTSCSMLVRFFSPEEFNPVEFAQKAYDTGLGAFGSWQFNTAHVFERCGGNLHAFVVRLHSFANLYKLLAQGIPVVVSVRGVLEGAPQAYPHGHLIVVVGFDPECQEVIVHDPAVREEEKVHCRYKMTNFVQAWERSRRLAYVVMPTRSS